MKTVLIYNKNPLMCSIYAQHVLSHCSEFLSAILVSSPVSLFRLKEKIIEGTMVCVIFDVKDWSIVDSEVGRMLPVAIVNNPQSASEVRSILADLGVIREI